MDTLEVVGNLLAHHGVKGMKWGVRRKATVGPQEVIIRDTRRKIKTSGGEGHPAHSDAVRARVIGQKGKASGLKSLSDQELVDYQKRLNLEANVKRLNYQNKNFAAKFVANLLGQSGKTAASTGANDVASHQVKKHLTRRLVKVGAVAAA